MKEKIHKIKYDDKEVATCDCSEDGCSFKITAEGKKLFSECCKDGCC
jgi:hypothetical protein